MLPRIVLMATRIHINTGNVNSARNQESYEWTHTLQPAERRTIDKYIITG